MHSVSCMKLITCSYCSKKATAKYDIKDRKIPVCQGHLMIVLKSHLMSPNGQSLTVFSYADGIY